MCVSGFVFWCVSLFIFWSVFDHSCFIRVVIACLFQLAQRTNTAMSIGPIQFHVIITCLDQSTRSDPTRVWESPIKEIVKFKGNYLTRRDTNSAPQSSESRELKNRSEHTTNFVSLLWTGKNEQVHPTTAQGAICYSFQTPHVYYWG